MTPPSQAPLPLRVHDLKQWAYCPRIVFYNYVMPVQGKRTYKMEHGRHTEEAIDRLEKRRKLTEFGLANGRRQFHVWCNSYRLGLSGKLDLLIDSPNGLFPVDFKATEASVRENHIVQLCGYALLLEEKFRRTVDHGFIFLSPIEEIVPIDITTERKQRVHDLLNEIRSAILREATPPPAELLARCENCEYRNYCGDIF
jgi:CRISPR-associated exonuclease Cas4